MDETLQVVEPLVTDEMNCDLTMMPSYENVKVAAFSLCMAKAPGPDGFNVSFLHKHWDILGEDVTKAV